MNAEFEVLFHPDMKLQPKEVAILYSSNGGKNFEDNYANRITEKNWNVQIFDLDERLPLEFFVRVVFKDGRLMLAKKEGQNYKIQLRDNTGSGKYKAQVRIEEGNLIFTGRRCLVCDQIIPRDKNICLTEECHAVYCPFCQRMLPPFANFCPWDKKSFPIR